MWVTVSNWMLPLEAHDKPWNELLASRLGCRPSDVKEWRVRRRSVDARKKPLIKLVLTIEARVDRDPAWFEQLMSRDSDVATMQELPRETLLPGKEPLQHAPVIIGFGPAGLFCALRLALFGYRPVVLEQGRPIEQRAADVERFWRAGTLDPLSNVQFGEGGAGTFSDGKLMTRVKDPRIAEILEWLVWAGGPPEIVYEQKPHIGTDLLRPVVTRLRARIEEEGGRVRFESRADRIALQNGRVEAVVLDGGMEIAAGAVFLAVGNSGRPMFESLHRSGFDLQAKPFAIGVRVEHPQDLIDASQYGAAAGHPALGHAEYRLAYHHPPTDRSVYSFCMCPGGRVIAAASEEGGVATNGMSLHARDSGAANSALVVTVTPKDFDSDSPLAGLGFQRQWEKAAYRAGGGGYSAPAQTVSDFVSGRVGEEPEALKPTYLPGTRPASLEECLPDYVSAALRDALLQFNRQIRGFAGPDAVLTGVETRTSSPVRMTRGDDGQAVGIWGAYPIGEGAGYAGGIISAALDGWNAAGKLITAFGRPKQVTGEG